tara:strand:- start:1321 stop:1596 length:276 start_codon:yes stop_codon:yes gene_type:complete
LKIDFNIGAFRIIVLTPSDDSAARNPVPITTPKRWGYVSLIPNFTPEIVKRIMFGPGVNKPTNTKIKSGKKSEIMTPQKKIPNSKFVHWIG